MFAIKRLTCAASCGHRWTSSAVFPAL